MSHKHENLLHSILEGPVSGNVHWREVESMLVHLGAKVDPHHGAIFRIELNGVEGFSVPVDHKIRMPEANALVMTVLRLEHAYLFEKELKAP